MEEEELCERILLAFNLESIVNYNKMALTEQQSLQQAAEEIVERAKSSEAFKQELVLGTLFNAFRQCALRSLPPPVNPIGVEYDPEEDEPVPNPAWPVLSCLYALVLTALERDPEGCRPLIDLKMVCNLLPVLDGEDPREREAVKTLIHRIYGAYLQLRAPMRRAMQAVLLETVHCDAPHKLAELLEIFGSIVNGFAVPLRKEHVEVFLKKCLLPLHPLRTLSTFFPQLAYCVMQFVEKDRGLSPIVIRYVLKHWPHCYSLNQVLLLGEIEELLDHMDIEQTDLAFKKMLFTRLGESISSAHFQVAERALLLWSNENMLNVLASDPQNNRQIMEIMFESLNGSLKRHWNKNVQAMAMAALSNLTQLDPVMFAHFFEQSKKADDLREEKENNDDGHHNVMNVPDDSKQKRET